jgi:hypothetical protein
MYQFRPLFTLLFLLVMTSCLTAQITLNSDNFVRADNFTDTLFTTFGSAVAFPEAGEDMLWDYSFLPVDSGIVFDYTAGSDPALPGSSSYEIGGIALGPFNVPSLAWHRTDESRWERSGETLTDTTLSVTPLTGGPSDVLHFVGGTQPYLPEGANTLPFPTTFSDTWNTTYRRKVPFELTVAAFGLNATPGSFEQDITFEREVIGYGQLRLPTYPEGRGKPIDVLLVRSYETIVDSIFLGGQPGPPPLISAFGLEQGAINRDTIYVFYGLSERGASLLTLAKSTDEATYRSAQFEPATGVGNPSLISLGASPNPLAVGAELSIVPSQPVLVGTVLELYDMSGRSVLRHSVEARSERISLRVPAGLPSGFYLITATGPDGLLLAREKLNIN